MVEKGKAFYPKNIRQVGQVDDGCRIYVEDYVMTYLLRMAAMEQTGSLAALLLGHHETAGEMDCFYIYGALASRKRRLVEGEPFFDHYDQGWLLTRVNECFPGMEAVGFALLQNECNQISDFGAWRGGRSESFQPEGKVFFRLEKENFVEQMSVYRHGFPRTVAGYQVFYDKNIAMQNVLVQMEAPEKRIRRFVAAKGIQADSKKPVTGTPKTSPRNDRRVTRQIRSNAAVKQELLHQHGMMLWFRGASLVLMTLLCVMGVTTINQYEKMKALQVSLDEIVRIMEWEQDGILDQEKLLKENRDSDVAQAASSGVEGGGAGDDEMPDPEAPVFTVPDPEEVPGTAEFVDTGEVPALEIPIDQGEEAPVSSSEVYMTYVVQKGDTLLGISRQFYQDTDRVAEISALNNITDPNTILCGQKLLLP